ncbi:hypothetical protein LPB136_10620 [Tenacibaculum todarodis]|uniref:Uncharacterized protein n=1 Tax=Tenacibaculum todarodis TaxID=1850252 RepID=A0A1L3JKW4_9FLAO|nr:hypothetical protein [Tenacibaculum todarodis]APG65790.1 hypothetical protein LPB136_10620 [Tenacibaculum todarodis]
MLLTKKKLSLNSKEVKVEKTDFNSEISEDDVLFGCSSEGNQWYDIWREEGHSHREARSLRRAFVRECRGGGWNWVFGVYTFGSVGL